jgi:hypothetical protein
MTALVGIEMLDDVFAKHFTDIVGSRRVCIFFFFPHVIDLDY